MFFDVPTSRDTLGVIILKSTRLKSADPYIWVEWVFRVLYGQLSFFRDYDVDPMVKLFIDLFLFYLVHNSKVTSDGQIRTSIEIHYNPVDVTGLSVDLLPVPFSQKYRKQNTRIVVVLQTPARITYSKSNCLITKLTFYFFFMLFTTVDLITVQLGRYIVA